MKILNIVIASLIVSLSIVANAETSIYETEKFKNYWYAGKAEITSYELEQARYGEIHNGHAVLIFVTEDLSKKKQVKLDNPGKAGDDAVKVLKLNMVRKFNTGIYRYSIMESVFTPVRYDQFPDTLKLTMSSQEWCGHVFTQMNLRNNNYEINSYSYFESEGDKKFSIDKTFLEDEIWNRIRLNPGALPRGNIRIIPSLVISRLKHQDLGVENAVAQLKESSNSDNTMVYSLEFPDTSREFIVRFEKEFPHRILSWEEQYKSGFGSSAKTLTTKAQKKESLMIDYWNKNSVEDVKLRKQLGID